MARAQGVPARRRGDTACVNPFDLITVPPAMIKQGFDDLHDIAQVVRRYLTIEDDILARVQKLEADLAGTRAGLERLHGQLTAVHKAVSPLSDQMSELNRHLAGTREAVAPLSDQMSRVEQEIVGTRQAAESLPPELNDIDDGLAAVRAAVEPLAPKLDGLAAEMAPIRHLEAIRRGIEPLEKSMATVRDSVDDLEPMLGNVQKTIGGIDTQLDDMQESVEPIGELADRIPGTGKRRR
jgi:septal ring factor EnvC (AmiA/AmiB activator)